MTTLQAIILAASAVVSLAAVWISRELPRGDWPGSWRWFV
jgi:hypothetical protein